MKISRPSLPLYLLFCIGSIGVFLRAEVQAPKNDSDIGQITILLSGLSDHSKSPEAVLDPALGLAERAQNLKRLSAPHYELNLVPEGAVAITGDTASIPIRVRFNSGDGNSLDASSKARFIKRDGSWYFSNFDFMAWPVFLIIVLVGGIFGGISYATMVLVLRNRLMKRGPLGFNMITIFLPFFWPALLRQTQTKAERIDRQQPTMP